jgi:hypothetical protein
MLVRTEKEKMLAGEKYNCLDPSLNTDRQNVKKGTLAVQSDRIRFGTANHSSEVIRKVG